MKTAMWIACAAFLMVAQCAYAHQGDDDYAHQGDDYSPKPGDGGFKIDQGSNRPAAIHDLAFVIADMVEKSGKPLCKTGNLQMGQTTDTQTQVLEVRCPQADGWKDMQQGAVWYIDGSVKNTSFKVVTEYEGDMCSGPTPVPALIYLGDLKPGFLPTAISQIEMDAAMKEATQLVASKAKAKRASKLVIRFE